MGIIHWSLAVLLVSNLPLAEAQLNRSVSVQANRSFVYHGKIVRPDGSVPTGTLTTTFKIYSPEPSLCLLWSETQEMSVKNGGFSAELGHAVHRRSGAEGGAAIDFKQIFSNSPGLVFSNAQCATGSTFTPATDSDRLLSASFVENGNLVEISGLPIKSVPFAMQAEEISGVGISNLARISGEGSSVTYSPSEIQSLKDLLGGNIHWDLKGRRGTNLAAPTAGTDAATKSYVDAELAALALASGTGTVTNVSGSGPISVTNGTSAPSISIAQASSTTSGYLSSSDWNAFTSKQPAGSYLTALTGDVVANGPGSVAATIQANAVTSSKISDGAVSNAKVSDVAWSKITATPSTLSGYGISDAVLFNGGQTGSVTVGSADANSVTITSAGSPRVTVLSGGNVGVGTASPVAPLDVAGDMKIGNSSATCDATTEGRQRYNSGSKDMEFCNGTTWRSMTAPTFQTRITTAVYSTVNDTWNYSPYVSCSAGYTLRTVGLRLNYAFAAGNYHYCHCEKSGNSFRAAVLGTANANFACQCEGFCTD